VTRDTNPSIVSTAPDLPVELVNQTGVSPVLLVCEHASNFIPDCFDGLGLAPSERTSHIAWDPGAETVSRHLSRLLDARLVACQVSRLVYDCNRSPEMADAIPERSEKFVIPGNRSLTRLQKKHRIDTYYQPFYDTLGLQVSSGTEALVTIHSFAPIYNDRVREVEIGIIHDTDQRLADALLANTSIGDKRLWRNRPYTADDGVTHTLKTHGTASGILNVMVEIRNDLIQTERDQFDIALALAGALHEALESLNVRQPHGELHAQLH